MPAYEKPVLEIPAVENVLKLHFGAAVNELTPIKGGNISTVFSFSHLEIEYVVKFSDLRGAFATERFIASLLPSQGVPFPQCIGLGEFEGMRYLISEKISGIPLVEYSEEQQRAMLPELIGILTRMNHIDLGETTGYGWVKPNGHGEYTSWKEYVIATFAEDQTGLFWEGWYSLFQTSCLEKEVFDECYQRLMAYSEYNEPNRNFIHGDFHPWNILSDGSRITGIVDGNFAYGDFLVDLVTLDQYMKNLNVMDAYLQYQEQAGIQIPHFKERFLGAKYFKGLDALRFFAKMGWTDAYERLRDELLDL